MRRLFIMIILCLLVSLPARAGGFDYSLFDAFFGRYVKTGVSVNGVRLNAVDYGDIVRDSRDISRPYHRLLARLSGFDPETLETKEDKLAFWINVYNTAAIKMIVDHYPVDGIRSSKISLFTIPWKKDILTVGGRYYSLDEIEHTILLGSLNEPMAHFGVVCASVSCADLPPEPYMPNTVYAQLDKGARAFVNNTQKGVRIDRKKGVIYVSKVFDWGKADFEKLGGIEAVLTRYLDNPEDARYIKAGGYKIRYMAYDWDANDTARAK